MSGALAYSEPYRLPAGALALAVHVAFFVLLYLGVNWRTQPPQGMVVDIWNNLPEMKTARRVAPPSVAPPVEVPKVVTPPVPVEPVRNVAPPKADIELADKKKPKPKPVEIKKPAETSKPAEPKKVVQVEPPLAPQISAAQQAELDARAAQAQQAAAAAAAITSEIGKYTGLIRARIRRFIVMPPDVSDSAKAEFEVTLLPDGEVLDDPKLVKSSGNAAYDSAVARAILKAQPLPLPPGGAARKEFLNPNKLQLKVSPKE